MIGLNLLVERRNWYEKVLFWILGIIGVLIIGGGVYAYTVYSNVSNTLDAVKTIRS